MTKKNSLMERAKRVGLYVDTYSPGDGVTRYRFFLEDHDYFSGDGLCTAFGRAEALAILEGFELGKEAKQGE